LITKAESIHYVWTTEELTYKKQSWRVLHARFSNLDCMQDLTELMNTQASWLCNEFSNWSSSHSRATNIKEADFSACSESLVFMIVGGCLKTYLCRDHI